MKIYGCNKRLKSPLLLLAESNSQLILKPDVSSSGGRSRQRTPERVCTDPGHPPEAPQQPP